MIRINLLTVEREQQRTKRRPGLGAAQKITIAASLIVVATALGIVWWFWALRQRSARLDQDIADAEAETRRLRSVLTQVQKFEGRRAQLQQRVSLIEELRRGQNGPVHMLDSISRSLPDRLWFTELTQTGAEVQLKGFSTSLTAISDLVANLEGSGYFKKPVEIVDSQVGAATGPLAAQAGELVRFEVKGTYQSPPPPALVKPPATAASTGTGVPPSSR
ncbi:MAG: PilN domain-containing protein [Vicinamibacterales bacterium]